MQLSEARSYLGFIQISDMLSGLMTACFTCTSKICRHGGVQREFKAKGGSEAVGRQATITGGLISKQPACRCGRGNRTRNRPHWELITARNSRSRWREVATEELFDWVQYQAPGWFPGTINQIGKLPLLT